MRSTITTLLFDFSWVLAFPDTTLSNSSSQAFEYAQQHQQSWKIYLALNDELIDFITRKTSHFQNYIFSASSPQMLNEIRQHLVPPFKQVLSSKELNLYKHQPDSYQKIAKLLKTSPSEILFIDDNVSNIEAAMTAGLEAIEFESNADFFERIKPFLISN